MREGERIIPETMDLVQEQFSRLVNVVHVHFSVLRFPAHLTEEFC